MMQSMVVILILFLSTLSLRRATQHSHLPRILPQISIHALLAESDQILDDMSGATGHFYPRSPCGERLKRFPPMCIIRHFYPRSPCGERPCLLACFVGCFYFYPRSPCGERLSFYGDFHERSYFYPRSPCGERLHSIERSFAMNPFLSTLSLRRATLQPTNGTLQNWHFYPRSPCGERPNFR